MEAAIFILRSCASSRDCHVAGRQTIGRNVLLVLTPVPRRETGFVGLWSRDRRV